MPFSHNCGKAPVKQSTSYENEDEYSSYSDHSRSSSMDISVHEYNENGRRIDDFFCMWDELYDPDYVPSEEDEDMEQEDQYMDIEDMEVHDMEVEDCGEVQDLVLEPLGLTGVLTPFKNAREEEQYDNNNDGDNRNKRENQDQGQGPDNEEEEEDDDDDDEIREEEVFDEEEWHIFRKYDFEKYDYVREDTDDAISIGIHNAEDDKQTIVDKGDKDQEGGQLANQDGGNGFSDMNEEEWGELHDHLCDLYNELAYRRTGRFPSPCGTPTPYNVNNDLENRYVAEKDDRNNRWIEDKPKEAEDVDDKDKTQDGDDDENIEDGEDLFEMNEEDWFVLYRPLTDLCIALAYHRVGRRYSSTSAYTPSP